MDYLLNVFFNSNTSDGPAKRQPRQGLAAGFQVSGLPFYSPWKWDWRRSDGPGWFETGELRNPVKHAEAALGKLVLRFWNRDPTMTRIVQAKVILNVTGSGVAQPVNTIFAAYKYEDDHGTHLKMFQDCDTKGTAVQLTTVPGGEECHAENGDQIMRSWDVVELYFSAQPQERNDFTVALFVLFGSVQPDGSVKADNKIFFLDPEMDIG
jgi:hypothetical protein